MSILDKTELFIQKAVKVHGDKFHYSKLNYTIAKNKVEIICSIHGSFMQLPSNHLKGYGCKKCATETLARSRQTTIEHFLKRAYEKHGDKYDYSLVDIKTKNTNLVKIICPLHGEFNQKVNNHLNGNGCTECKWETLRRIRGNDNFWKHPIWLNQASTSKDFTSFKVYLIKCWDDTEEFYKVGRTFRKIEKRFTCKIALPYNYEIIWIKDFGDNAKDAFNLEHSIKNKYKEHSYTPRIFFKGMHECFDKTILNEL